MSTTDLTPENHPDREAAERYLAYLQTNRTGWPKAFYEKLMKLMSHNSWEPIPTRVERGKLQFMYSLRSAQDLAYPPHPQFGPPWYFGGAHNRGETANAGLERVSATVHKSGVLTNPEFIGCINWSKDPRGPDVGLVFLCPFVGETPPGAAWHDFEEPPGHMIEGHGILVQNVIRKLRSGDPRPSFWEDPR